MEREPFTGEIDPKGHYETVAPVVRILRLVPDLAPEPESNVVQLFPEADVPPEAA